MKFIYLYIRHHNLPGVDKKIIEKAIQFERYIDDFQLLIIGKYDSAFTSIRNVKIINSQNDKYIFEVISNYFDKINKEFVVLMRYNFASIELYDFVKKYGKCIFFEHNTIEEFELKSVIKKYKIRDFLYLIRNKKIHEYLHILQKLKIEKQIGGNILNYVRGGICVTNEIAEYEISRCKFYKTLVSSNPIPYFKHLNKSFDLKDLNGLFKIVFISGGAYHWHGFERWLLSLKKFKNNNVIQTFIVGEITQHNRKIVKYLKKHGHKIEEINYLDPSSLSDFLKDKHLGIGSLGLYKNNMQEACPLKSREYIANGLPILIGYFDTDFSKSEFNDYVYRIENNKSLINIDNLLSWLYDIYNRNLSLNNLYDSLHEHTYDKKISKIINFIKNN